MPMIIKHISRYAILILWEAGDQKGRNMVSLPRKYAHQVFAIRPCLEVVWNFLDRDTSLINYAKIGWCVCQYPGACGLWSMWQWRHSILV